MVTIDATIWTERALVNSLVIRAQDGHRDIPQARPEILADQEMALALGSYLQLIADGRQPLFVTLYQMPGGQSLLWGDDISDINSAVWQAYDNEVIAAWRARKKVDLANSARARVANARTIDEIDISDIKTQAESLNPPANDRPSSDAIADKAEQMYEWARNPHALIGVTSGIAELDRYTSGLRPALHGIGARPDMGKTSFMAQCIMGQLKAGLHVYCAALEDGAGEIASRIALQELEAPKEDLRKPEILDRYMRIMADVRDHEGITWHEGDNTAEAIERAIEKASTRRRVDCIWVDHLGYMRHPAEPGANISYRIGQTTKALQRLSLASGAPVMMFVQLNREGADGKPPELTDFRESGEIEQDIRIGWFLHRPAYYSDDPPAPHILQQYQIWIRKAKDMPTGPINLMWRASCARIYPRST